MRALFLRRGDLPRRRGGRALGLGAALVCAGLAGCEAPPSAPVNPDPPPSFRRGGAPIGSALAFDAARAGGTWVQVAHFPGQCDGARMQVVPDARGLTVQTTCRGHVTTDRWEMAQPGRFVGPEGDIWVLWVDIGYRTLVLGRPDGTFGAVWNRSAPIPADRRVAAREMLDFNGYDVSRLTEDTR